MTRRRTVPTEAEAADQPEGGEDPTNEASSPPTPTVKVQVKGVGRTMLRHAV